MTITVVPNPSNTPPRNEITVAVPAGQIMTNPALYRIVGGVATLTPTQPSGGLDTRIVYDYESPYDQPVVYQFATNYFDPAGISTVWDETWANLSAWSGSTSSWGVFGGTAQATVTGGAPAISRALSGGKYRVTCAALSISGFSVSAAANSGIFLMSGSTVMLQIAPKSGGGLQLIRNGAVTSTSVSSSAPFTIDLSGTTIVISGTGGSTSLPVNATITSIQLAAAGPATTTVGRLTVSAYGTVNSLTNTAAAATLSPAAPWLIHPSNPGLSMPVSSKNRSTAMIRTLGEVSNASQVTEHQILGQQLPITTTSGPRMGNKLQVVVGVRTAAQEQALMGLLADGTPILFRAPAGYPIGLEEGYYSIGDITRGRLSQRLGDTMRDFTLPLTQVQRPAVTVQNAGWSWAALAAQFSTWQAVAAAFNTWADVAANNRKPGY